MFHSYSFFIYFHNYTAAASNTQHYLRHMPSLSITDLRLTCANSDARLNQ